MIITAVLQVMLNVMDFGMNIQDAIDFPRVHHQWKPDQLGVERGVSPDTIALLKKAGYNIEEAKPVVVARVEAILLSDGWLQGGHDCDVPRPSLSCFDCLVAIFFRSILSLRRIGNGCDLREPGHAHVTGHNHYAGKIGTGGHIQLTKTPLLYVRRARGKPAGVLPRRGGSEAH